MAAKLTGFCKTNASLGGGGFNECVESENLLLDTKLLDFFKATEPDLITCWGESMQPLIDDGTLCMIDRQKAPKNKGIYVINTKEGLFVKQIFLQDKGVILHSLHPAYEDIFCQNGEFLIVGAVVGILSRILSTHSAHRS